jgi:signal transduction histidine kinase
MIFALNRRSIAFRLIAAVLAVELISALAVIFLSIGFERHSHFRAFEIAVRGRADSILGAVEDAEDPEGDVTLNQAGLHVPADDVYEVHDDRGRLLGRSPNWQGLTEPPRNVFDTKSGSFFRLTVNGQRYRLLLLQGSRIVDPGKPGGGKVRQVTIVYGGPTEHVWRAIRSAVEFYAAGSVILLLVTGPLIAWLLHRGLVPLRQLAALAGNVSVDSWQFSPPATARTTPELAPLTHAIESVLARLERSFNQQKAFVSDAAHELKTAVAVIKSSMQLLAMKSRSPEEYKAGLERCLSDSQRLEDIVAKMLTLARLESIASASGPPPVCDLKDCLQNVLIEFQTLVTLRDVQLIVRVSPAEVCPVPVAADDCSLLLSNLLLNALQHTPPRSKIEVRIACNDSAADSTVDLIVEDRGDGIAPEVLPHVFDRFYRGDPSRTRNTGGSGLGLAIVKAIVDRAGGSIHLASQPGQGTTVTVHLPLVAETQPLPTYSSG